MYRQARAQKCGRYSSSYPAAIRCDEAYRCLRHQLVWRTRRAHHAAPNCSTSNYRACLILGPMPGSKVRPEMPLLQPRGVIGSQMLGARQRGNFMLRAEAAEVGQRCRVDASERILTCMLRFWALSFLTAFSEADRHRPECAAWGPASPHDPWQTKSWLAESQAYKCIQAFLVCSLISRLR